MWRTWLIKFFDINNSVPVRSGWPQKNKIVIPHINFCTSDLGFVSFPRQEFSGCLETNDKLSLNTKNYWIRHKRWYVYIHPVNSEVDVTAGETLECRFSIYDSGYELKCRGSRNDCHLKHLEKCEEYLKQY